MTAPGGPRKFAPIVMLAAGLVGAALFTLNFPAVQGLGNKVRLPVFHGALTWVNLASFTVLALLGLVYVVLRRDAVYRWEEAVRFISVPIWILGSVLGLLAALGTWDFTGSKSSPLAVAGADPRLVAQAWIMLAGMALLALGLLIDDRRWLAVGDVLFVGIAWAVIMRAVLGPGRALHPDSPVLNSDEMIIKLLFFGIVLSLGVAVAGAVWWVRDARESRAALEP